MDSLESVFLQAKEDNVYAKLQSLIEKKPTECIKGLKCTKKCFSLFESRGEQLLAEKHLDNFRVLVSTLRLLATPTVTYFKKFIGFGLAQMMSKLLYPLTLRMAKAIIFLTSNPYSYLKHKFLHFIKKRQFKLQLLLYPPSLPGLFKTVEELLTTVGIIIEYSVAMATSFLEFIPLLLRIGSDHYKQVSLRFEVIRILNELLKLCPVQRKSSLVKEKDIRENLVHIGANLHNAGDFELQVGLLETLSRFTDMSDRRRLGPTWFDRINLTDQYLNIREEEFDVDSRYFLNSLNKSFAFNRSVYSLSCQQFNIGTHQLCRPSGMSEFWVDFNTSSRCVSAFTEDATASDTERMWETLYVKQDEVDYWTVTQSGDSCCHTLLLSLNSLLPVPWDSSICSKQVTILFSCDPRNAVIRTVGKDKERKQQPFLTSGNTTITKQSKTSIALVPVRVNLPVSTVGSKEESLSPVFPNHFAGDVLSSQDSKSSVTTPARETLPPKTPQTSTPKRRNIIESLPEEKSVPVYKNTGSIAPSSAKGSNKTPKLVKQPLSFVGSGEIQCKDNTESDFVVSKRNPLKEKMNRMMESRRSDGKQKELKPKPANQSRVDSSVNSSLERSFTRGRGKDRRNIQNSSLQKSEDSTFDFPDSPPRQTKSRKGGQRQPLKKRNKRNSKGSSNKKRFSVDGSGSDVLQTSKVELSSGSRKRRRIDESLNSPEGNQKARSLENGVLLEELSGSNDNEKNTTTDPGMPSKPQTESLNHTHISQSLLMDEAVDDELSQEESLKAVPISNLQDNDSETEQCVCNSSNQETEEVTIEAQAKPKVNMIIASQCSSVPSSGPGSVETLPSRDKVEGLSVCGMSVDSFHSSQVQADQTILQAFEETCSNIVNNSKKEKPPNSRTRGELSPEHINQSLCKREWLEQEPLPPPKKHKPQAIETPVGMFYGKKKRKSSVPSTKRSGIGDDDSNLAIPNGTKDSNISNIQDHCSGSGREFLFGFEQQLSQEASRIENGLKKSEGCSEKAMNAIREMSSENDSVHQIVSQIKELYGTLFVDLRAMSSQERGTTQRKHQSVIEEMKMQRQRMLKQAHDKEVQHVRKTLQSLIMCWEL